MKRLDLTGNWQLAPASAPTDTINAPVPGDTHSALLAAGRIADPYWAENELDLQQLGRQDWIYSRDIEVGADLLAAPAVFLNCDCLDTLTTITINGKRAGTTDNMFRRYRFEVKRLLKAGANRIEIHFKSAENAAIASAKRQPYPIPYGANPVQSPHRNLVRKVQCHSGWDWGCCLMVAGIYGDIYLGAVEQGRIEYVATEQHHARDAVKVDVSVEVTAAVAGPSTLEVTLGEVTVGKPVSLVKGANTVTATVTIDSPQLWWPNGYGEQPLYPLTVRVAGDEQTKRLGLRTLELVTEEDEIGLSFAFHVNGVQIFCKGANWIPTDALPQRQTREVYADLMQSAAQAHMNMIRVWGGGQYEPDVFYDICDELGLLIWHDFMFSCATYPTDKAFLDTVSAEITHQVKRLRDHACIALWCGNNENLGALGWYQETRENRDRYLVDYYQLYEVTVGRAVDAADPTRTYWPSSPCGGRGDFSDCWHDDTRGDMHYWSVWHSGKSFDAYYAVVPRFCSEFGYQSFPSVETIRTYAPDDQLNLTSPVMEHHQRNRGGNSKIIEMFSRYFRMPDGFASFVYLSQVQQAVAIRTAVEHWRRLRPTCMGTLYWQLNDNWPVASWASVEYGGKWKLLHYAAKRFFQPVAASIYQTTGGDLEVWLVNDLREPVQATIRLEVIGFDGHVISSQDIPARIGAGSSRRLRKVKVDSLAGEPKDCFIALTLDRGGEVTRSEHFFTEYKRCNLAKATVTAKACSDKQGLYVEVNSDLPAFFVSLDAPGCAGVFSDNAFLLTAGETRHIRFTPKGKVTLKQLEKALAVTHLRDTYQ